MAPLASRSPREITTSTLRTQWRESLDAVVNGEHLLLTRRGIRIAVLVPPLDYTALQVGVVSRLGDETFLAVAHWAMQEAGVSRAIFAEWLGVSPPILHERLSSGTRIDWSPQEELRLTQLYMLRLELYWLLQNEDAVARWLHSPVPALGGRHPIDVLRVEGPGPVLAVVEALVAGTFS